MKINLTILALIAVLLTSQAQEKWSMEACINYALEHHHRIGIQKERIVLSKQNYLEALGALLPSIQTQIGAGFSFGSSRDYSTQAITSNNTFSNQYQISASLMLFDGLSSIHKLKMERIHQKLSRNELQNQQDQLSYEVVEAYLNLSYYEETVQLAAQQVVTSQREWHKMQRMAELGLVSRVETTEAAAKHAQDRYFQTQQENLRKIALILLKEKLNYPLEEELHIEEIRPNYPVQACEESVSELFAQAVHYLPQALVAQNQVDAQQMAFRGAKGGWFPRLSLVLGSSTNYFKYLNKKEDSAAQWSYRDQLKDNRGEFVQFNLSFPLFTGFGRSARVRRAKANYQMARYEQDQAWSKIYRDMEQSLADLQGQVADYAQAVEQEQALKIAHEVNIKKQQEGLIDPLQLSLSANRLLAAQLDSLRSYHSYILKLKIYQYYKGIPYTQSSY